VASGHGDSKFRNAVEKMLLFLKWICMLTWRKSHFKCVVIY
jgi:hypothetical protein